MRVMAVCVQCLQEWGSVLDCLKAGLFDCSISTNQGEHMWKVLYLACG